LLVILIENAFKFVSNSSARENKIGIKIFIAGTTLHSSFFNKREVQETVVSANSNGIGIVNLKRRLQLLYPQKHKLTTNIENDFYETNLSIDLA
jgi:LytS/YehU family sensor histidine kinase